MLRSLAAGQRQRAWIVTWYAAAGVNHAKPGTGHCIRLAKEAVTLVFYMYRYATKLSIRQLMSSVHGKYFVVPASYRDINIGYIVTSFSLFFAC